MSASRTLGTIELATAAETRKFGVRLAAALRAGDVVVLSGALGAGKTTLTQGIGAGLAVRGDVTSPTFVIARVHRSSGDGPDLVHVDAYRLASLVEVDDLDLDASLSDSVTVVEWGEGKADGLSEDRLVVELVRGHGDLDSQDVENSTGRPADPAVAGAERRTATLIGIGTRWASGLGVLLAP